MAQAIFIFWVFPKVARWVVGGVDCMGVRTRTSLKRREQGTQLQVNIRDRRVVRPCHA